MEVRCNICGKLSDIEKTDKDYERLAKNTSGVYICEHCNKMLSMQAAQDNEWMRKKTV